MALLLYCLSAVLLLSNIVNAQESDNATAKFHEIRKWRYMNFTWENEDQLQTAVSLGQYIPENVVISGIGYYDDFYYLSLARIRDGVPATLARIPSDPDVAGTSPLLMPYPSWSKNALNDCDALQNVQNIEIDSQGRLWIVDGGRTATLTRIPTVKCTPKLIIHDLNRNETIRTYNFPDNVVRKEYAYLYDIVVDGDFAYITDNTWRDPGIIVYSMKTDSSWKIRHNSSMKGQSEASNFKVDGALRSTVISLAGIALGAPKRNPAGKFERRVYYTPMSSYHLYSVSSLDLQDEASSNDGGQFTGNVTDHGVRQSQTDGMIMDDKDTLYYGLLNMNAIAEWNTSTPFATGQKLIAKDPEYVQWPNSFTFNHQGQLVVLTDRLQTFIYSKLNLSEDNFRLLASDVHGRSYVHVPPIGDQDEKHSEEHERRTLAPITDRSNLVTYEPNKPTGGDHEFVPVTENGTRKSEPTAEPEPAAEPEPTHEHNTVNMTDDVKVESNVVSAGATAVVSIVLSIVCISVNLF